MIRLIGPDDITIKHRIGEDASGNAINVQYTISGYFEGSSGLVLTQEGHVCRNAMKAVLDASGYGEAWEIHKGDLLECRGSSVEVLSYFEAWNPRNNTLHHVEAECQ